MTLKRGFKPPAANVAGAIDSDGEKRGRGVALSSWGAEQGQEWNENE